MKWWKELKRDIKNSKVKFRKLERKDKKWVITFAVLFILYTISGFFGYWYAIFSTVGEVVFIVANVGSFLGMIYAAYLKMK